MKNFELKIAREILGLTQAEAAKEIGNVSVRSWNYWESNDRAIPTDVQARVNHLLARRKEIISLFLEKQDIAKQTVVIYYNTPDYCNGILDWRFSQSLARTLSIDFGASLVEFDPVSYFEWLDGKKIPDSQTARSEWAVHQAKN